MPISREKLTDMIVADARRDRKRLETVADGLATGFKSLANGGEDGESEDGLDSDVVTAYAEEIAAISDSLSKITHELVELVKLEKKGERDIPAGKLNPQELEDAFNEIQPEEQPN